MDLQDLLQWGATIILAGGGLWVALRKSGSEKASLNGNASKAYAEAATLSATQLKEVRMELHEAKDRLAALEKGAHYRITIDFTLGEEHPMVQVVKMEPITLEPVVLTIKKPIVPKKTSALPVIKG